MEKILFMALINTALTINGYSQLNKDTTMVERFQYGEVLKENPKGTYWLKDKWMICIEVWNSDKISQIEYAPAKEFYKIEKEFYANGILAFSCKFLGNVPFGERKYYDESGNLTKVIDEDKKFGKLKPRDIVNFIEKIGWINRETGESIILDKRLLGKTDGSFYQTLEYYLKFNFYPAQYSTDGKEIKPPGWNVAYRKNNTEYQYAIDGNTGENKLYKIQITSTM